MPWGAEEVVGAGRIAGANGDKDGGVGRGGSEREEGGEGNSPVVTLIFERTYAGLPCDLRLTPDFSSCSVTGLCGRPSIVLDGSSACVCVSDRECLARHRGAGSARLASASVIRMDGGKMETGM